MQFTVISVRNGYRLSARTFVVCARFSIGTAVFAQVLTEAKPPAETYANANAAAMKSAARAIPVPSMTPMADLVTPASENPKPDRSAQIDAIKSYVLPAAEIVGFNFLLNRFNRHTSSEYATSFSSIGRKLRGSWVTDNDPFNVNQLGHPYQGAMYPNFARSVGLSKWESLAYTFVGCTAWEIAGETPPPSRNDQIASGIGGTFLGEAMIRMSNLILEQWGGVGKSWREAAAAEISPAAAFNRHAFGSRYANVFASRNPRLLQLVAIGIQRQRTEQSGHVHHQAQT